MTRFDDRGTGVVFFWFFSLRGLRIGESRLEQEGALWWSRWRWKGLFLLTVSLLLGRIRRRKRRRKNKDRRATNEEDRRASEMEAAATTWHGKRRRAKTVRVKGKKNGPRFRRLLTACSLSPVPPLQYGADSRWYHWPFMIAARLAAGDRSIWTEVQLFPISCPAR